MQNNHIQEMLNNGYYVVIDPISEKIKTFKNLTEEEILNYKEWDCIVLSPKK